MTGDRRTFEAAVAARASSVDGRRFTFQHPLEGLELEAGGYVSIGHEHLGQVHAVEQAWVEGAELRGALGDGVDVDPGLRISLARGHGVLLHEARPFHAVPLERADEGTVADWLEQVQPERASLDVGELLLEPGLRFRLDAGGFSRHTFLCGQSGSGKTYALGVILEQLLLETTLRVVVLDPNSDFVRLAHLREDVDPDLAARYRAAVTGLAVRRANGDEERLHVRFSDADPEEQAALLRLDPIGDREEFGALLDALESGVGDEAPDARAVMERLLAAPSPALQALGARVRNLGIDRWSLWSLGDKRSLQDLVAPGGPRALVVDVGSLESSDEMALAAESVLASLWRHRAERVPVLVVVDEAHNVCPREPTDPVTALATEHMARLASEGRKFGIYLLVATQRPRRVDELVVSQCDNLVLMRMNSPGDLAYVADLLAFAPPALLERALSFRLGESLVSGTIGSHPALVRFGPRISEEGGGDVPRTWAQRGDQAPSG